MLLSNVNEYIRKENFIVDILNKMVFFVMISSYIIKELKNLVLCRYGVIMHSGECWENTQEACKTLGYASAFYKLLSYSPNIPPSCIITP